MTMSSLCHAQNRAIGYKVCTGRRVGFAVASKRVLHVVPPGGDAPARKSARVLIADDDRDNATMLAAVLRDEGHEATVALRGDDALDMCRLFRPDVVIADINLPGTSGYAIARELREQRGNLAPLLIAMTGVWTKTTDRVLGQAVGFDYYLVKPYELKELLGLIKNFLSPGSESDGASGAGELT